MDQRLTGRDLFDFMDSGKKVRVVCKDGAEFTGRCFAYSAGHLAESDGIDDYGIEVGDTLISLHEIRSIERLD